MMDDSMDDTSFEIQMPQNEPSYATTLKALTETLFLLEDRTNETNKEYYFNVVENLAELLKTEIWLQRVYQADAVKAAKEFLAKETIKSTDNVVSLKGVKKDDGQVH